MSRSQTIDIENIKAASAVCAATGIDPAVAFTNSPFAKFIFPDTPEVRQALIAYETGLSLDARELLNVQARLFKRIRGGR